MKTSNALLSLPLVALILGSIDAAAATPPPEPHRVSAISMAPTGHPLLTLAGGPGAAFRNYFDLFRLESSTDLVRWNPMVTVVATNASANAPTFVDDSEPRGSHRFYRAASNHVLTPFQPPTGPHAVGTFSRLLTDPSRSNRFGLKTNSAFMATFWYPTKSSDNALASYMDRPLAERRAYWGTYTNAVPALVQYATSEAPILADAGTFPVVVYSHGLGDQMGRAVRTENTGKAVELASHGYMVVSMDHTDTYATVLPPSQLIAGRNVWSFAFAPDRIQDVVFLLDRLGEWQTGDPIFQGRLDLERIGIMGWSFGGGTAAEACRVDDRLKGAVLLDPYLTAVQVVQKGLTKPYLNMAGTPDPTLFAKAQTNAYQLTIDGATHESYTDNAWTISPNTASRRRARAMEACMVSFFDKHLKGLDDRLLENPRVSHPDVIGFRKK